MAKKKTIPVFDPEFLAQKVREDSKKEFLKTPVSQIIPKLDTNKAFPTLFETYCDGIDIMARYTELARNLNIDLNSKTDKFAKKYSQLSRTVLEYQEYIYGASNLPNALLGICVQQQITIRGLALCINDLQRELATVKQLHLQD